MNLCASRRKACLLQPEISRRAGLALRQPARLWDGLVDRMLTSKSVSVYDITIEIGDIAVSVRTESSEFARLMEDRYAEFVIREPWQRAMEQPVMELDVELLLDSGIPNHESDLGDAAEDDVSVRIQANRWVMERGDFRAEWDPECRRGWVRQSLNPYAIDSVLRILHSLILARSGGFLIHAASAVRNGRAFIFAGESGAGKTTLSRLAPRDATILTDEISYVKPVAGNRAGANGGPFEAFGTPFAGELARIGQKTRACLAGMFILRQGPENRLESLTEREAAWELFRHVLFFARDEDLVRRVFESILEFVRCVPVQRMAFQPNAAAWELIA